MMHNNQIFYMTKFTWWWHYYCCSSNANSSQYFYLSTENSTIRFCKAELLWWNMFLIIYSWQERGSTETFLMSLEVILLYGKKTEFLHQSFYCSIKKPIMAVLRQILEETTLAITLLNFLIFWKHLRKSHYKIKKTLFIEELMSLRLCICIACDASGAPQKRKNQNKLVKSVLAHACLAQNTSSTATVTSSVWKA